jgi:hypothetical protein
VFARTVASWCLPLAIPSCIPNNMPNKAHRTNHTKSLANSHFHITPIDTPQSHTNSLIAAQISPKSAHQARALRPTLPPILPATRTIPTACSLPQDQTPLFQAPSIPHQTHTAIVALSTHTMRPTVLSLSQKSVATCLCSKRQSLLFACQFHGHRTKTY